MGENKPTEPMKTTVPDFFARMYGKKARVTFSAPKTLVLNGKIRTEQASLQSSIWKETYLNCSSVSSGLWRESGYEEYLDRRLIKVLTCSLQQLRLECILAKV
jgi:hypothetical protein